MKILLLLLMITAAVTGCTLPVRPSVPAAGLPATGGDALWRIAISRSGVLKFSGLLATRLEAGGLSYVLLDATGVTLLEARLTAEGGHQSIRELGMLSEHRLPGFLAESLRRIFLLEPAREPCGRNFLLRFCRENRTAHQILKSVRFGPVVLWSAEYSWQYVPGDWTGIGFANPRLGAKLTLTRLQRPGGGESSPVATPRDNSRQ